jgi:NAD(P)H-hydrate epimerase
MKIVTDEQMRAIDRIAIEVRGVPSLDLMERAGAAVADVILQRFQPAEVAVCTGKGNNAGDGFVIARRLSMAGVNVRVHMGADRDDLRGDALANHARLPYAVECISDPDGHLLHERLDAEVVVDAVLGTGITGRVREPAAQMIASINDSRRSKVVAVDLPSGLNAQNLEEKGECVRADVTVTFGWPKVPMVFHPGVDLVGDLVVADIGFDSDLVQGGEFDLNLTTPEIISPLWPARAADGHKGTFGHLLLIAGSEGMSGAAALAALAGVRSGVGLVTIVSPACCMPALEQRVLSAIKRPQPGEVLDEGLFDRLDLEVFTAVAVGPGMDLAPRTRSLVKRLVREIRQPLIIDADGLNALEREGTILHERRGQTIVTPHPKEMARVAGWSLAEVLGDRLGRARAFAEEHRVVTVLKGARTVIVDPSGEQSKAGATWVNPTGNTGLAKGGSGDVLTGLIGGLAAQGVPPLSAATLGVYWHGHAADLAAAGVGERTMAPEDVIDALGSASLDLGGEHQRKRGLQRIDKRPV